MISKDLHDRLKNELEESVNSNNPELVERLNLACMILDNKFVSDESLKEYINWMKDNDNLSFAVIKLFTKYIYAKRVGSTDLGIYPFLVVLFDSLQNIINVGEFPELKSPGERVEQIKAELSSMEEEISEKQKALLELEHNKNQLEFKRKDLEAFKQKYSVQIEEYEQLRNTCELLEKRLAQFQSDFKPEIIETYKKQNEVLERQLLEARAKLKDEQNWELYYNRLTAIEREYNLFEQINFYKRVLLEISEDLVIADNITSTLTINTAALQSAVSKLKPFYEELKTELKTAVRILEQI